jgi:hypothetical protein
MNPKGETKVKDAAEARALAAEGKFPAPSELRLATIHETMGPNWKHIYWVGTRPLVRKEAL